MTPKKLFLEDGKAITPRICGVCNRIWASLDEAERCCVCSYCGKECQWKGGSVCHDECWKSAMEKTESETLDRATLVPDYAGPFLCGDNVCMDVEEFLDYMDDEELPEFGFCTKYQAPQIEEYRIIESIGEHMHEDWEPNDVPELAAAIELWNEANKDNGTYWEDRTRKWAKADLLKSLGSEPGMVEIAEAK